MRVRIGLAALLATCLCLTAVAAAQEETAHEAYVHSSPDGVELPALVVQPNGEKGKSRPAIVIVHGGGWALGEASWGLGRAKVYADQGLVAITVGYRLSDAELEGDPTPLEAMEDVRNAIRWVRANAADLGIDPNRVAGYGWSAGAHLLACAAIFEDGGEPSTALDALILTSPAVAVANNTWVRRILDGEAEPADISPDRHVAAGLPPTLLLQGRTDTVTPLPGTERFHEAMLAAGNSSELIIYEGVGHLFTPSSEPDDDWPNPDPEVSAKATAASIEFLREQGFIE